MSSTNADLVVRVRNARQARRDAQQVAGGVREIGTESRKAGALAEAAGRSINRGMSLAETSVKRFAGGTTLVGAAITKMGLSYNASLQSSEQRFELFTDSASGALRVLKGVQGVDLKSSFDLTALADAAAYLGNAEVSAEKIPTYLQGIANASAAAGGGNDRLERISTAIGQIQTKGKLSAEEIQQLAEAGVNVRSVLQREFGLTGEQVANIGNQTIDAGEALDAIIKTWTSGKMAKAAEKQTKTLGGQWDLLTGNAQKLSGALTSGLSESLRKEVLPATNDVVQGITAIFGNKGLTNEQKLDQARRLIKDKFGPIADELGQQIERADIPHKLSDAVQAAVPWMLHEAGNAAPKVAGAFVDAWMDAPIWVKLLSAGWLAKKLTGGVFGAVGGGIGKGMAGSIGGSVGTSIVEAMAGSLGGRISETLLGRGGSPARPLFVVDVTRGLGGGGGIPGGAGKVDKTPKWARVGKTAGKFAGPVGATIVVAEIGHALAPNFGAKDLDSRAGGGAVRRQADRAIPVPGFGGDGFGSAPSTMDPFRRSPLGPIFPAQQPKIELHAKLVLDDGRELATTVDSAVSDAKARR